jgi:ABC-type branched-subunit amino acid transport system substrate-binding protein
LPGREAACRLFALGALAALAAAACGPGGQGGAGPGPPQRTVKIALVGVFSGIDGAAGRDQRNSVQLEAADINARGGLLGARLEVVSADGEMNPGKTAELVREQVGDPNVALVVGPGTTAGFTAARGALERSGVPNCMTQVADDALGGARSTFRAGATNSVEVLALLSALHRSRPDLHRIGLLDEGDEIGHSYDVQLAAQSAAGGMTYAGRVGAGPDADQRTALQQLTAQGAQVVVVAQHPEGAARAAQATAQLGAGRPVLAGFDALAAYAVPTLGGDAAVGAVLATTAQTYLTDVPQAQWPAGYRAFVSSAARLYGLGTDGVQLQATPAGADCLLQWARAVADVGTFNGPDVTRAWERLELAADETALGVRERLSPADHSSVGQEGLFAYTWTRAGSRYRLKPVAAG